MPLRTTSSLDAGNLPGRLERIRTYDPVIGMVLTLKIFSWSVFLRTDCYRVWARL